MIRNQLSSGGLLQLVVGQFQIQVKGKERALAQASFITDEGVKSALKLQGEIVGLKRAIQSIFDLAEPEFIQND